MAYVEIEIVKPCVIDGVPVKVKKSVQVDSKLASNLIKRGRAKSKGPAEAAPEAPPEAKAKK